jgi:O-antigen/teichoic acid export membrane protein
MTDKYDVDKQCFKNSALTGKEKDAIHFAGSVATLAGGAAFASGLVFLAEPITSRLFPPESFGQAVAFISGANIVGMVACLRYEKALVLPENDEDAGNIFALSALVLASMIVMTAALTLGFGRDILGFLNMEALSSSLWLFPVAVFVVGLELLLRSWYTRYKQFNRIALSRTMLAIPRVSAELGGGAAGFTSGCNLILFRIFGLTAPPALLLWNFLKHDALFIFRHCTIAEIWRVARRYIKFPLFELWSVLLMVVSWNLPVILLSVYFGDKEAGFFAKALYILYAPVLLFGDSVSQVFLQLSAARKAEEEHLGALVEAVLNRMISFGVLPLAFSALIGADVFGVVLGSRWSKAGVYAQLISPWVFMILVHSSISTLFGTLERQDIGLLSNLILCVVRLGILVAGGVFLWDVYVAILLFSWASVFVLVWKCSYLVRVVKASHWRLVRHFFRCTLFVVPALGVTACVKWWINAPSAYIVGAGIVSSLPYAVFLIREDAEMRKFLLRAVNRVGFVQ